MHWNSLTHVASESDPDGSGKRQMTDARRLMHSTPIHAQSSKSRNARYKLANRVSSGNTTLNRDILLGISGITKSINSSMDAGDRYLAGFGKRLFVGLSRIVRRGEPL
jgi:hypothetical protein